MALPLYFINAFTTQPFGGNPAAVMPLAAWLPDATLQALAEQHNLSETAFLVPAGAGAYELRWFTPAAEVALCGHATLAAAHVLRNFMAYRGHSVTFHTRFSGALLARYLSDDRIELDFPALPTRPHEPEPALLSVLGVDVVAAAIPIAHPWKALYEVASEAVLRAMAPDFAAIGRAVEHAVIVTARGNQVDFVSRFFAPNLRVNEDPVTGSAHCVLTPYWAGRLGRNALRAAQLSARGGELACVLDGDRVRLTGQCVSYATATLQIAPD